MRTTIVNIKLWKDIKCWWGKHDIEQWDGYGYLLACKNCKQLFIIDLFGLKD